jgi:hypothetical protein
VALARTGLAADAFVDPTPDLGFDRDTFTFGDAAGGGKVGRTEQGSDGVFAAKAALAHLAHLGGRELQGPNGLELVPDFRYRMGLPIHGLLLFVSKVRKRECGRWKVVEARR